MNLGDIKRRVTNMLGDDAKIVFEDNDLNDMVNDAQVDIARKTGFLQAVDSFDSISGKAVYDIQLNCIEVKRVTWYGTKLTRTTWQELDMIDPGRDTTTGVPDKFYMDGNKIGLYPTPNKTSDGINLAISVYYTRTPIPLSSDTANPELPIAYHEDIVTRVISRGHELVEDFQASQVKAQEYNQAVTLTQQQLMDGTEETYPYIRDTEGPFS